MAKKILVHGSGHKAASWKETVSCMDGKEELLCPDLCALLAGKTASYPSLYGAFAEYCDHVGRAVHLCGLSLGGILALNYALDFPEKVKTLVLIDQSRYLLRESAHVFLTVFSWTWVRLLPIRALASLNA